ASSVASAAKPRSAPSARIAAMPSAIESWRNSAVLEKTSTEKEALVICAAAPPGCRPRKAAAPSSHSTTAADRGHREPTGRGAGRRLREKGMRRAPFVMANGGGDRGQCLALRRGKVNLAHGAEQGAVPGSDPGSGSRNG